MYAVISTGGKQYRVEPGTTLLVEKLADEAGTSVTLDQVLLVSNDGEVRVGTPTVPGASVRATVLGEQLGEKVVVFKYKQKARYRRRTGHRQHYTQLRVDEITLAGETRRTKRSRAETPKAEAPGDDAPKAEAAGDDAPKPKARDESPASDEKPKRRARSRAGSE